MDRVGQALRILGEAGKRLTGEEGQGLVEYGLILMSVMLVVAIGGSLAGIGIDSSFRLTAAALGSRP